MLGRQIWAMWISWAEGQLASSRLHSSVLPAILAIDLMSVVHRIGRCSINKEETAPHWLGDGPGTRSPRIVHGPCTPPNPRSFLPPPLLPLPPPPHTSHPCLSQTELQGGQEGKGVWLRHTRAVCPLGSLQGGVAGKCCSAHWRLGKRVAAGFGSNSCMDAFLSSRPFICHLKRLKRTQDGHSSLV